MLLIKLTPRPAAILAGNDVLALSALPAFRELRLQCPQQRSLIGFDTLDLCQRTTSTDQRFAARDELGFKAATLPVKRIRGDLQDARHVIRNVSERSGTQLRTPPADDCFTEGRVAPCSYCRISKGSTQMQRSEVAASAPYLPMRTSAFVSSVLLLACTVAACSYLLPVLQAQTTAFPAKDGQIPGPTCLDMISHQDGYGTCTAADLLAWRKDVLHWRDEARIRMVTTTSSIGGRSSRGRNPVSSSRR